MKQYIKPITKEVTVRHESLMFSGSLLDGDTSTQYGNERRGRRGIWGNLWDDSAEFDASTEE